MYYFNPLLSGIINTVGQIGNTIDIKSELLRDAMRHWTSGVAVVTSVWKRQGGNHDQLVYLALAGAAAHPCQSGFRKSHPNHDPAIRFFRYYLVR